VDVDVSGNVYVTERSTNSSRVQKFNSSGVFITKWGSYGDGNGLFAGPEGIAIDSKVSMGPQCRRKASREGNQPRRAISTPNDAPTASAAASTISP
jgi:hypothetical protein